MHPQIALKRNIRKLEEKIKKLEEELERTRESLRVWESNNSSDTRPAGKPGRFSYTKVIEAVAELIEQAGSPVEEVVLVEEIHAGGITHDKRGNYPSVKVSIKKNVDKGNLIRVDGKIDLSHKFRLDRAQRLRLAATKGIATTR